VTGDLVLAPTMTRKDEEDEGLRVRTKPDVARFDAETSVYTTWSPLVE